MTDRKVFLLIFSFFIALHYLDQLRNIRVLKKNTIFVNFATNIFEEKSVSDMTTYEDYGQILDLKVKKNYKNTAVYVTYSTVESASLALVVLANVEENLKVLYGTVQYCKYFLKKAECKNSNCSYMHVRDKKNEIVISDEIDEEVFAEHYDMAFEVVEEHWKTLKIKLRNKHAKKPNRSTSLLSEYLQSAEEYLTTIIHEQQILEVPKIKVDEQAASPVKVIDPKPNPVEIETNNMLKDQQLYEYIRIKTIKNILRKNQSQISSQPPQAERSNKIGWLLIKKIIH